MSQPLALQQNASNESVWFGVDNFGNSSNTTLLPLEVDDVTLSLIPLWSRISLSFIFGLIGFTNIFGNSLTLIAYFTDEKLRTTQNVYILNLALTDLSIGIVSVPTFSVYSLLGWYWPFGRVLCKAYMFKIGRAHV